MNLSEISMEIKRLEALKKELVKQEEANFLEDAKKHIGRCFRIAKHLYVKVLDVPQYESTMHGAVLNTHQFPGIIIDLNKSPAPGAELGLELDTVFSGCWGVGRKEENCEEITPEEFELIFNKRLEEIRAFVLRQ